jgi:hypothetical protein
MADNSLSLSLPFIQPNQAQKHVTHNEALRILDILTQLAVETDDLATPPPNPAEGLRHIVGDGAIGAWSGRDGDVALYENGAWQFFIPKAGWRAYVISREAMMVHDGNEWIDLDNAELQDIEAFGLGMVTLAEAPFSAKLNAAFWTALYRGDGGTGSFITTMNKEESADDLGLVLQQDFRTKALLGLFGTDDFRLATSTDGSNFKDGLIIRANTGIVDQPELPRFKATTNFDNFAAADTWIRIAINSTDLNDQGSFDAATNLFTAPVAGSYLFGATVVFRENATDQVRMSARLVINGTDVVAGSRVELNGPHVSEKSTTALQTLVGLAAGDTVELQGNMRSNDAYFLADETSFWGMKIG